ncbi:4-aminobutyrate--2-oxoglutarate transaminase [Niallia sp. 03133]|uniref:4-aminobutyrate--2-oxoglutarate transaminase n=1 Tax=Niallia sp. 03133 TaxID=3458060 RepID=UPI004043D1DD
METIDQIKQKEQLIQDWDKYVTRGVATAEKNIAVKSHGCWVEDIEGNKYLDFAAGIGALNMGHTPFEVVEAIQKQTAELIHTCFSVIGYPSYIQLAKKLTEICPIPDAKVLLANSGAEAVENAIKIARYATGKTHVIAFKNAFHGRTFLTMTLTGKSNPFKINYGPLAPYIHHEYYPYPYRSPFGSTEEKVVEKCMEQLEDNINSIYTTDDIAAIIVEPVQGDGGFIVGPPLFFQALRKICDKYNILLIVDEIQTGFGRTGKMFAIEHAGITPDLMTVGKSLSSGLPLSAVIGKKELMDAPKPGALGGTYGGNPVACSGALAAIDYLEKNNLCERAMIIGDLIMNRLKDFQTKFPQIGDVRGLGAMNAIEIVKDPVSKEPHVELTNQILKNCRDNGLLIIKCGQYDNVIRLLVPLIATEEEVQKGLNILELALEESIWKN